MCEYDVGVDVFVGEKVTVLQYYSIVLVFRAREA